MKGFRSKIHLVSCLTTPKYYCKKAKVRDRQTETERIKSRE